MTLQDYTNLAQNSINNFFSNLLPTLGNIVAAIIILAIGIIIGWILKRVVEEVSKALNLEKALSGLDFYSKLVKSHEELDFTTFISEVLRWTAIIVFLIPAVTSLQIEGSDFVFSQVFTYVSNVLLASLYLLFGFAIAWFVHRIVMAVASIVGNNPAHLLANIAYLSIVIFAILKALLTLGVTEDLIRLFVIAAFAATALAFGLGGKDTAIDWLKKFVSKAK